MPSLFHLAALLLAASFQSDEAAELQSWEANHYEPPALPLTGYEDSLSGRLAADGTLDTGLVRLRFSQGTEGVPLDVTDMGYGKGPQLWAAHRSKLGDVELRAVSLGLADRAGTDKRLVVATQVRLTNPTDTPRKVVLNAELLPSHESPLLVSVPFDGAATWAREGNVLTRDGQLVAGWVGTPPEVEVQAPTDSPDAPVAKLVWRLEIPAGGVKYVEVKLAGPFAGEAVDEAAWRKRFGRRSYAILEEVLGWQGQQRGTIGQFKSKSAMLGRVLINGVHVCRMFGAGKEGSAHAFSDRPYGQPATDAAVEAEIVGCMTEFGMGEYCEAHLARLIDDMPGNLAQLDDERKVAYLHGLARAIRLWPEMHHAPALALAITELGDPDVAVAPWHDPDVVREDLTLIVSSMGMPTDGLMTRLRWADVEEGTTAATMQAARKAIRDRNGLQVWEHFRELFQSAEANGIGSMDGGEIDASYSLGMLTLGRAMLLDDHGDELNMYPGGSVGIMSNATETDTTFLPSRFGMVKSRAYHIGPKVFGNWTVLRGTVPPSLVTVTVPDGLLIRSVKSGTFGGEAVAVPGVERLIELQMDPVGSQGIRIQVRVAKE